MIPPRSPPMIPSESPPMILPEGSSGHLFLICNLLLLLLRRSSGAGGSALVLDRGHCQHGRQDGHLAQRPDHLTLTMVTHWRVSYYPPKEKEGRAKVVAVGWGMELNAALVIQDDLKKRMNRTKDS